MNVLLKGRTVDDRCAIASFSFMAVAGRDLSANYDTFEIMLYRSLVGVVIVMTAIATLYNSLASTPHLTSWADTPCATCSTSTGQNLWFYAVAFVPHRRRSSRLSSPRPFGSRSLPP